mmetsp:Transcript_108151/g.312535  ORF Transcript_108151/g.312535 Transcript_108151/m.312535 type:complete len:218 (+) Transcript_108151:1057-1710(+)
MRHCTTLLLRGARLLESPLKGLDRILQGACVFQGLVRDPRQLRAEIRDGRPQGLAVVLPLTYIPALTDIEHDIRELNDLAFVGVNSAMLALVAGPLEVQTDPKVKVATATLGGDSPRGGRGSGRRPRRHRRGLQGRCGRRRSRRRAARRRRDARGQRRSWRRGPHRGRAFVLRIAQRSTPTPGTPSDDGSDGCDDQRQRAAAQRRLGRNNAHPLQGA